MANFHYVVRILTVFPGGKALHSMLEFGTDPEPSPMVKLRKLAAAADLVEKHDNGGKGMAAHFSKEEVEDIWKGVLRLAAKDSAAKNDAKSNSMSLSQQERREISLLAKSRKIVPREVLQKSSSSLSSSSPSDSHFFTCVKADRYLRMESTGSRPVDALKDSMCRSGFAVAIFRTALGPQCDILSSLLSISTRPTSTQATDFLRFLCRSKIDPEGGRDHVIIGWFLALHAVLKGLSNRVGSFNIDTELCVCVRPPRIAGMHATHPWKWVPFSEIDRVGANASHADKEKTRVFVNDSTVKANLLDSLLQREGFCSMAVLAQTSPFKNLQRKVLDELKLPRLSDDKYFRVRLLFDEVSSTSKSNRKRKRRRSGNSSAMPMESERLDKVCELLRRMEPRLSRMFFQ